jgi:hypothetical protein
MNFNITYWGWGLGIGDWPNPQSPIPNPQSPIPNPQSPILFLCNNFLRNLINKYNKIRIYK